MRKLWTAVAAAIFLTAALGTGTAYAHDAEYGMWTGEQNGLLLGIVEEAGEDWVVLKEVKALPSGDKGGVNDRQLPPEEVPERLKVTDLRPYLISYNKVEKPQAGQCLLVSADLGKNGEWKALWPPNEVSSLDTSTLEFQTDEDKNMYGAAWERFVHSGGKDYRFAFEHGDLSDTLYLQVPRDDGTMENQIIFQRENKIESQAPDSLEAAPDKETAAVQESATAGQTEPETTPAAQAAGAETTQAEETGTASMGLETVLIAIAAGFFGGMVISRLRKNKKR